MLDIKTEIPCYIHITDGKVHEINVLDTIEFEPNGFYVMDRDFVDFVLKELKTFVNTNDQLDAVVITIPASFDTIQSNATKEAGIQAEFKQVVLLQEPIAASLAYANMKKERDMKDGQWLVYDLGGGTFDVALIKIKDKDMKVLDHEGNNFLGGLDFDSITREDGGYNSGLKKLSEKIREDLPLVGDVYNFFKLTIYDGDNNIVETGFELIGINSGWGNDIIQPLPEDICLEVDDYDNAGDTKLELIFQKNSGLPNKKQLRDPLIKTY